MKKRGQNQCSFVFSTTKIEWLSCLHWYQIIEYGFRILNYVSMHKNTWPQNCMLNWLGWTYAIQQSSNTSISSSSFVKRETWLCIRIVKTCWYLYDVLFFKDILKFKINSTEHLFFPSFIYVWFMSFGQSVEWWI